MPALSTSATAICANRWLSKLIVTKNIINFRSYSGFVLKRSDVEASTAIVRNKLGWPKVGGNPLDANYGMAMFTIFYDTWMCLLAANGPRRHQ